MSFSEQLANGKVGESLIARYMMSRGHAVLPVYEIEKSHGKGPQLFLHSENLVAPDMLIFTKNGSLFIEAKHKSVFTWHRITKQWTTGIDIRHYYDYLRVAENTKTPVWLMFYHRSSQPSEADKRYGCPKESPTGLFGEIISTLSKTENHRSSHFDPNRMGNIGHGRSGMVYWAQRSLKFIATKESMERCD